MHIIVFAHDHVGTERLALTKVEVCKKDAAEQGKKDIENAGKSRWSDGAEIRTLKWQWCLLSSLCVSCNKILRTSLQDRYSKENTDKEISTYNI